MILSGETAEASDFDALLRDGVLSWKDVSVSLTRRADARLIISFLLRDDEVGWLDEITTSEDFSELRITATSPNDLVAPQLKTLLQALAKDPSFTGTKVSVCGARSCCAAAAAMAQVFTDPTIVLFDPDSETEAADIVFFDPFSTQTGQNDGTTLPLKCFASGGDSITALTRMQLHRTVVPAALQGELDAGHFYNLMRKRKDYRFYRMNVEKTLEARGKAHLVNDFRDRFRARRVAQSREIDDLQSRAAERRPVAPGAWARLRPDTADRPSAPGNVWMLQSEPGRLRYLSDRWQGVTMGYVEQDGVTLAETSETAIGIAAFGDGQQVERPLPRRFRWHVVDTQLDGTGPAFGPVAEATLSLEQLHAEHSGLVTAVALGAAQPGITAAEALPGSGQYQALIDRIETACTNLAGWNKALVVDRLRLSLLTGAPATPEADAASHYAAVAQALSQDITTLTTQAGPPTVVIVPQAGLRHDGTSEIALAEARFDLDNPTLTAVIPTPAYPFALMKNMPATHSAESALLMDEICMLALRERQNGRPWHCPQLQLATVTGSTVTTQFSTMDGLVLENEPHGFHLVGENAPEILNVEVSGATEVTLTLDAPVTEGGLQLAYAWGHRTDRDDSTHAANHGALRDHWQHESIAVKGRSLHRFALPARVPLQVKM